MTGFKYISPPNPKLEFGDLLGRTMATLRDRPLFIWGLAVIAVIANILLEVAGNKILLIVVSSLVSMVISGAIVYGILKSLNETTEASLGEALAVTLRWPILGLALLDALFSGLQQLWADWSRPIVGSLIGVFGDFILIGLYFGLFSIFFAALPACLVENLGLLASLRRSLELTEGHRIRLFLIFCMLFFLFVLLPLIVIFFLSTSIFDGNLTPVIGEYPTNLVQVGGYIIYIVMCTLAFGSGTAMSAIIYDDLRALDEPDLA